MGVFDHDLRSDVVYCSPEVHQIFGWPPDLEVSLDMLSARAHPEDRADRDAAVARAHDPAGDGRYDFQYRIVRADGAIRWVHTRSQTFFKGTRAARKAARVIGAITDVTEARAALALLQDREDRLRRAETLARMGHFSLDPDGGNAVWSTGNKLLYGFEADATPSFDDFVSRLHPADRPRLAAAFARAAAEHDNFEIEFRVIRPEGEAYLRSLVECTTDAAGRVRFFGTNIDVTAQKQAEAGLIANQERLAQAVRLGRLGIFDHNHVTGEMYVSPEQRAIWGIGPYEDVSAEQSLFRVHPEDRERAFTAMRRSHDPAGDGTFDIEHRVITADGGVRWIHNRAQTSFIGEGAARKPVRTVGATADITDLKQVEVDLRIKDNALNSWVRGVLIIGLTGKITYANPAWLQMHRCDTAEVLGRNPFEFVVDPDQHDRIREALQRTGSWTGEVVARRQDGTTFDAALSTSSVTTADGRHVAFLGSIEDVTERKRAEAQVRRSEAMLRSVFEASQDAIVVTKAGRVVFANPATAKMYGLTEPADMLGEPLANFVPESELPRVLAINRAREQGLPSPSSYETKGLRRDKTVFDAEISASTYTIDGEVYPLVVIRDVSARKAAERALRESAERLSKVFNSTSEAQILHRVTDDGRLVIVSVNDAYRAVRDASFPGVSSVIEGRYRDDVLAEQGMTPAQIEMEMPAYRRVIATRQPVWHELEIPLPNGDLAVVEAHLEPVLDEDGRCTHVLWVGRNITDRKRAEADRERLERQLEQVRKMESIGQLAGGIAHDFNNMLTVVLGNVDLMRMQMMPGHPLEQEIAAVEQAAQRSKEMARQLLAFSRQQIIQPMVLDLNEQITATRSLFATLIGEQVTVAFRPDHALWPVLCDPSQIDQVLLNLVVNARDAMPRGGTITVETRNVTLDQATRLDVPGALPGEYVSLEVRDEGVGIDPKVLPRIFEPFFTTKNVSKGTGLGLATVYGIVKQNGWYIRVDSEPDQGSSFRLYMPRPTSAGAPAIAPPVVRAALPPLADVSTGERRMTKILLVEDDEMVRNLTSGLLGSLGYTVFVCDSPTSAIARLKNDPVVPDLLLTDVVMPSMTGPELRDRLIQTMPGLKTVLMSGYTSHTAIRGALADTAVRFIQKPFTKQELEQAIRELLEG
ncbi:MAG TPA: PAS domain S-box protein [Vicinamibacterales bacterium]|jgi:PAS domain S-box-containing protein|nr:PAS domain S-box protein [Vicinamibacterales bacterium]